MVGMPWSTDADVGAPSGLPQAVTTGIFPRRRMVEIIRAPGAVAFVGDPARVTWGDEALAALLSGPGSSITLEAEDLRGGEHGVLVEAPGDGDRDGVCELVARLGGDQIARADLRAAAAGPPCDAARGVGGYTPRSRR